MEYKYRIIIIIIIIRPLSRSWPIIVGWLTKITGG